MKFHGTVSKAAAKSIRRSVPGFIISLYNIKYHINISIFDIINRPGKTTGWSSLITLAKMFFKRIAIEAETHLYATFKRKICLKFCK